MKKMIALVLALAMTVMMTACAAGNNDGSPDSKPDNGSSGTQQSGSSGESDGASGAGSIEAAMVPGKLNFIDLDDRDASVLRGVTVYGNRCGSTEYNYRQASVENVRSVFEINEYVGFIPDTDLTYGIRVWILEHREDQSYYEKAQFSDLMPGFANYCDLHLDTDDPESSYWGEFYLGTDDCEPGYYDFVFVYEGKAIATLLTRFYSEGELENKSDAELDALMK